MGQFSAKFKAKRVTSKWKSTKTSLPQSCDDLPMKQKAAHAVGLLSNGVQTLTYDNGKEFADHAAIDKAIGSTTYFADPYSSWQRGSNENLNRLIRQYIPKSRALSTVTDTELAKIERLLNTRPRKRRGYKTPMEIFTSSLNRVALPA